MSASNGVHNNGIPGFNKIKYNSNLSGTTGARLYKNATGKKWVVKQSEKGEGGPEQVKMESVVNDIYAALGILVPPHKLYIMPFPTIINPEYVVTSLVLEHIDGKLLKDATPAEYEKAKKELQQGFIVDALLANWDVIGLKFDNIIIPTNKNLAAVRIDNGGSLIFRAQGGKKEFTDIVNEINTMRNPDMAPQAYEFFGDLTTKEINEQIETIIKPNQQKILDLTPDALKPTMAKRINNLLERLAPEWVNNSPFKNNVKETAMPEYIPAVQTALIAFFKDGWDKYYKGLNTNISKQRLLRFINKILKDNKAIISGGFILKAIGKFDDPKSVDIDIYVPTEKVGTLKYDMARLFNYTTRVKHNANPESKHTKDGILSVSKYSKGEPGAPGYAEMDIVEVNADKTPIDIIKNFDFTFCENWYDGTTIFMAYPEHVEKKAGLLEKHYMDLLYAGDSVLFKRMEKYIGRGFKISLDVPGEHPHNITNSIKNGSFLEKLNTVELSREAKKVIISPEYTPEIATQIKDKLDKRMGASGWGVNILNTVGMLNNPIYNDIIPDATQRLTQVDIAAINHYTEAGYVDINVFLYENVIDKLDTKNTIFKWLKTKFSKTNEETLIHYNTRLLYYYFVNLYNAVQKGPRLIHNLPPLYRGVKEWYLDTKSDKFYYTNSFMSTSPILSREFGKKIYAFYVHPACVYLNVTNQSSHLEEYEVLLTPYHRYIYDKEEIRKPFIIRKYIILPMDFNIPDNFEEYMVWKNDILEKSSIFKNRQGAPYGAVAAPPPVFNPSFKIAYRPPAPAPPPPIQGGRDPTHIRLNNFTKKNTRNIALIHKKIATKNTTNKNLKGIHNIITRKNNTRMRKASQDNALIVQNTSKNNTRKLDIHKVVSPRFTDPIPSFPGKAPNKEERKVIDMMRQNINNDKGR